MKAVVFDVGETLIDESGSAEVAWGHLHDPPAEAIRISSLDELPGALGG